MRFADFVKQHVPVKHPVPLWLAELPPEGKRRKTKSGLNTGDIVYLWNNKSRPWSDLDGGVVTRLAGDIVYVKFPYWSTAMRYYASNLLRKVSVEHARAKRKFGM